MKRRPRSGKGIAVGLALIVIICMGAGVTTIGLTWLSFKASESMTILVSYNEQYLMEDKLYFDSEKNFLRNSLLVSGLYAVYRNGANGTLYDEADDWPKLMDYICWKDLDGTCSIPPEETVLEELESRIDDTFRDYFSELEYTVIDDITPLDINVSETEFNLSYQITEFNMTSDYLNHTIEEKGVWINVTVPLRYLRLYRNAKDFTENSETKLNDRLIDALNYALVCTGEGRLTEEKAEEKINSEFLGIAGDLAVDYPDTGWELRLLSIDNFEETVGDPRNGVPHHYIIEFTVRITVRDIDPGRKVANVSSLENSSITFAINDEIEFYREVEFICSGEPNCAGSGSPASCDGTTCTYWTNDGPTDSGSLDDCDIGTDCYCEKTESPCDCGLSPPDGCYNEDDYGPDIGCFQCGSRTEPCCNEPACTSAGCRGSLRCRSASCTCVSTSTTTSSTTTTTLPQCPMPPYFCMPPGSCTLLWGGNCINGYRCPTPSHCCCNLGG